jgi:hypothetical protein
MGNRDYGTFSVILCGIGRLGLGFAITPRSGWHRRGAQNASGCRFLVQFKAAGVSSLPKEPAIIRPMFRPLVVPSADVAS